MKATPYRNALVCGMGASGLAAARLLRAEGCAVTLLDRADTPALRAQAQEWAALGAKVALGCDAPPEGPFDVAVVSPGVPWNSPWLGTLRQRNVALLSELELGWSRFRGRTLAVTGSNGKSTAVKWLAEAIQLAGQTAVAAGNYGLPAAALALMDPQPAWAVLEVSSFQLETCKNFRADAAALLNVLPNHLDRHGTLEAYLETKSRIFSRTLPQDLALVPVRLQERVRTASRGACRWVSFGSEEGAYYHYANGGVERQGHLLCDLQGTHFANEILGLAGAAVVGLLDACGFAARWAEQAARAFQPLPHRMQIIAEARGVSFINDSKATNLGAMMAALRMLPRGVRLIAGGLPKETDWRPARPLLQEKVRGVYLIGQAAAAMQSAWQDVVPCRACATMENALRLIAREMAAGEQVLLSPACASFDQFHNYEERGKHFVKMIEMLTREGA